MKELIRLPVILTIVTVVAAGALAWVFNTTKPKIEAEKKLVQELALKQSLPKAAKGIIIPVKKGDEILYYKGFASPDTTNLVGYIVLSSAHGYSSTIEVMIGVDTTGVIQGVKILSQSETPGLGAKISEVKYGDPWPWFQHQFIGKKGDNLKVDKDGGTIKSVTGATISSRAVTKAVREGVLKLEKLLGKNKTLANQMSLILN